MHAVRRGLADRRGRVRAGRSGESGRTRPSPFGAGKEGSGTRPSAKGGRPPGESRVPPVAVRQRPRSRSRRLAATARTLPAKRQDSRPAWTTTTSERSRSARDDRIERVTLDAVVRLSSIPIRRFLRVIGRSSSAPVWVARKWTPSSGRRSRSTIASSRNPSQDAPDLGCEFSDCRLPIPGRMQP